MLVTSKVKLAFTAGVIVAFLLGPQTILLRAQRTAQQRPIVCSAMRVARESVLAEVH